MIKGWTVTTFVRSELPLTKKVAAIQSYTYIVLQEEPPAPDVVEAFVSAHLRNFTPVYTELSSFTADEDIFNAD